MLASAVGGITAVVVAISIGPAIFEGHLDRAVLSGPASETEHAISALRSAGVPSIAAASAAAVLASLAASVLIARRIRKSLDGVTVAAGQLAAGDLAARAPLPGIGDEFDQLASTINNLAARLEGSEVLRRRLIADVAHELRTPAATISAYLEAIEDGVRSFDSQTAKVLGDQSQRLTRLAADLASASSAAGDRLTFELEPLDIVDVVGGVVRALRAAADDAGVALALDARADGRVVGDWVRLSQLFTNLLDNALKHTAEGDRVSVTVDRDGLDAFTIVVSDTGAGIAPEHLPHIFERFYRADEARDRVHGGAGIGLSIAKSIVEAHGGELTAESDGLGEGAAFTVRLPADGTPSDI